ncbi:MAG: AsmA-like C-terminal region-containing protein [Tropicimonas sp.]|uniref:YhdP family protein n=1 Tax=Tropicimonas sp. TaxID=2067044 RepID=UPI003A897A52
MSWLLFICFDIVVLVGIALLVAGTTLAGRDLPAPDWAAERVADMLSRGLGDGRAGIGAVTLRIPPRALPQVVLHDVTISAPGDVRLAMVPSLRVEVDKRAIWSGKVRAREFLIEDASIRLRRKVDGSFDLGFGGGNARAAFTSLDEVIAGIQRVFELPALAPLERLEARNLRVLYEDARVGRSWRISDGSLLLSQSGDAISLSMALKLPREEDGIEEPGDVPPEPGEIALRLSIGKNRPHAEASARMENVPAADIAAQSPALSWLAPLQAPVSGAVSVGRTPEGRMGRLSGTLEIGAGVFQPETRAEPVPFDGAHAYFGYRPDRGRITFDALEVHGPHGALSASGHADLIGVETGWPVALVGQLSFSNMRLDPPGFLPQPAEFDSGRLDMKASLRPFRLEIGQLQVSTADPEGERGATQLLASGLVTADASGWHVALDLGLDRIGVGQLMALWPMRVVPRTRDWLARNLLEGELFGATAGFRFDQGSKPKLALSFGYENASVRAMRTLPAITDASGYAASGNFSFSTTLEAGRMTPPEGGAIDIAGATFRVSDMRPKPSTAEVLVQARSSVTAALSLLDQAPFRFLTKAGQPVTLSDGQVQARGRIAFPMKRKIGPGDTDFDIYGQASGLRSTVIVPGRALSVGEAAFAATPAGLHLSGSGDLDGVPLDAAFELPFGPDAPTPTVDGNVEIGEDFIDTFGIGLPDGMVTGAGPADFSLELPRGAPVRFRLTSPLRGVGLALPALGWSSPTTAEGSLSLAGQLGAQPLVDELSLQASGLRAEGRVTTRAGGGLEEARFSRVALGDWLDAPVTLTGRARGQPPGIALRGGRVDLRKAGLGGGGATRGGGGTSPPLSLALDRLVISEGISITDFRSDLEGAGGYSGNFTGLLNGQARVSGTLLPGRGGGTTVQLRSDNAGAVLKAAGMFRQASGGDMTLTLEPRGGRGEYDGTLRVKNIRVQSASGLTALVNAISVVGLIDELAGTGLLFTDVEAAFRLTPSYVQVTRASGVGPSLGISLEGVYDMRRKRFDFQGVFSPVYMINSIGRFLTRKGEGLIGFNYRMHGPVADPQVEVNPLSVLTPGMFREIFRAPPPKPRGGG